MDPSSHPLPPGVPRAGDLPERLDLSAFRDGLADLRRRSMGLSPGVTRPAGLDPGWVEHGACFVLDNGVVVWRHWVEGTADGVDPLPTCDPNAHPAPGYDGFAHTHLPDPEFGGLVFGFSSLDYLASLCDGDRLSLVCNGVQTYGLARTADATAPPCATCRALAWTEGATLEDCPSCWERLQRWEGWFGAVRAEYAGGGLPAGQVGRALWSVNRRILEEVGFGFYAGPWHGPLRLIYRPRP